MQARDEPGLPLTPTQTPEDTLTCHSKHLRHLTTLSCMQDSTGGWCLQRYRYWPCWAERDLCEPASPLNQPSCADCCVAKQSPVEVGGKMMHIDPKLAGFPVSTSTWHQFHTQSSQPKRGPRRVMTCELSRTPHNSLLISYHQ